MNMNDYQNLAFITDDNIKVDDNRFFYYIMGLTGEAGEVSDKFKKLYRDFDGKMTKEYATSIAKELGDVLWYIAVLSQKIGFNLDDVAHMNIEKLMKRKDSNTISGEGDDR